MRRAPGPAVWALSLLALAFAWLGAYLERPTAAEDAFAARDPGGLRVLTWNIGGSAGDSGRPLDDAHLQHVADVLRELDPDVAVLQELQGTEQLERLRNLLGSEHWQARLPVESERSLAVLCKRGELSAQPVGARGRIVAARYQSRKLPAVELLALHSDAFSARRRNLVVGAAMRWLEGLSGPRLLLGDLNLDLDPERGRDVFSDNAYRDVESYNVIAGLLVDAGLGRGNTAEPDRRLDYIFYDPQAFKLIHCAPWKGQRVGDMDHDPLVADLGFRR